MSAAQAMDAGAYEQLIRRMKVLSKAQTAFLKTLVHTKLQTGTSLVNKAVEVLSKSGTNDPRMQEIKNALLTLKLDDLITVDLNSTQVMFHEELSLLRGAVDKGLHAIDPTLATGVPPSKPPKEVAAAPSAEILEKISILEKENFDLLIKFQESEVKASKAAGSDAEVAKLNQSIELLNAEISKQAKTIDDQAKTILAKENGSRESAAKQESELVDQVKTLKDELKTARLEVNDLRDLARKAKKDGDDRIAAKVAEMEKETERKLKEVETKLEGEKEVMMDAMAQEVEDLEKQKESEKAALIAERDAAITKLDASHGASKAAINKVRLAADKLAKDAKASNAAAKKDLADMKAYLKTDSFGLLIAKMKGVEVQYTQVMNKYKKELEERKKLHNIIQELKGNIRVFMRCRPPSKKELEQFGGDANCVTFPGAGEVRVFNEKNREKVWEFDEVFDMESTQESVYREVSQLVTSVMDGYNVCIFAYGQTGSGKTWTMSGPPEDRGVNTRALDELFIKTAQRAAEFVDTITLSILEVYNEDIHDLLVDSKHAEKLEIRQAENGIHVPGLTLVAVQNLGNVFEYLQIADKHRSQTSTNMNEHSSRSHMMLTITVQSENIISGVITKGKLNLVDLAGSERLNKSGASGNALKEAQNINKSLSALGDVIAARANKQSHIPFRNSTLTYLLQDSLSQDSKTLMFVCTSPVLYNSEETFCSLNFASRVRSVELGKATKNTVGSAEGRKAEAVSKKK